MTHPSETIRIVIPLVFKRRNGKPKIFPADEVSGSADHGQDPNVLRAIGRAWAWRRKLESGKVSTLSDIARAEGVTLSYISRFIRLAYLSPDVMRRLVIERRRSSVNIADLAQAAQLPWHAQAGQLFD